MQRNLSIDYLRCLGLSLIILAHVYPPFVVFNLRCFDVPMMVFISGLAYAGRRPDFSFKFMIKRFKRLIIPVWVFLTAYFMIAFLLYYFVGIDFGIRQEHIIGSYLLQDGIGYVWIIRVFLLIALFTPLFLMIENKVQSNFLLFLLVLFFTFLPDIFVYYKLGINNEIIQNNVLYLIGYGALFFLGLRFNRLSGKQTLCFLTIGVVGWIVLGYNKIALGGGNLLHINAFKYPPQAYYLLYGVIVSVICYCLIKKTRVHIAVLSFIGMNTIWIYLYHIPLIQITGRLNLEWWMQYLIVYTVAVTFVSVQIRVVKFLSVRSTVLASYVKYFCG